MIPMITHLSTSSSDTDSTLTELSSIQLELLLLPRPRPRPLPLPRPSEVFFCFSLPRPRPRLPRPRGSGHDGREESSAVFGLFLLPGGRPRPLFTGWTGMAAGAGSGLVCQYQIFRYQLLVNIPLLAPTCYQLPQFEHLGWALPSTPAPVGGLVGRS